MIRKYLLAEYYIWRSSRQTRTYIFLNRFLLQVHACWRDVLGLTQQQVLECDRISLLRQQRALPVVVGHVHAHTSQSFVSLPIYVQPMTTVRYARSLVCAKDNSTFGSKKVRKRPRPPPSQRRGLESNQKTSKPFLESESLNGETTRKIHDEQQKTKGEATTDSQRIREGKTLGSKKVRKRPPPTTTTPTPLF